MQLNAVLAIFISKHLSVDTTAGGTTGNQTFPGSFVIYTDFSESSAE